ncbi:patatin-like phospholipase family protein [Sphingomonas sp.]|uniref:patatin-like phospholipase family protein n=1 Tax=Sphingomonas sp. TaxID=28214 RepID=UPI0035BBF574
MSDATEAAPPLASTGDAGVDALIARRRAVRLWWGRDARTPDGAWSKAEGPPPIGLALSGGGIRSATFSLGLIQALARSPRDALANIDVLSTVSGGGYVGCFLRSLFVPGSLRGIAERADDDDLPAQIANQHAFARTALASGSEQRNLAWTTTGADAPVLLRNPVWWLREHSRYLAPTGASDYGFALAYIARNWLAMIYLVALACVALGVALVAAEAGALAALAHWFPPGPPAQAACALRWPFQSSATPVSPLFWLAPVPVAAVGTLMVAYWSTQAMSTNEAVAATQRDHLRRVVTWIVLAGLSAVVVAGALILLQPRDECSAVAQLGPWLLTVIAGGTAVTLIGALVALAAGSALRGRGALLTTELRLRLTKWLASANMLFLGIVAVAMVDTLGARLDGFLRELGHDLTLGSAVALPVLAFIIKKLPDWFGGGRGATKPGGGIGGLLRRFATAVAFVIGAVLYAAVAVGALALVHHVMWSRTAWVGDPLWWRAALLAGIAWLLSVLLGQSTGFINLSSLHALYASRLTRAYLGASNLDRLERAARRDQELKDLADGKPHARDAAADSQWDRKDLAPVTENNPQDYIQPRVYGETDLPAPIHVINVTLNETIDPTSQIVTRDRKGDILSVEPGGVRVGRDLFVGWHDLRSKAGAEIISLGQWCAISGAAASSAMGRMTSLGFALAFTFANVRLGYWWYAPKLCPAVPPVGGANGWIARHFGTFVYLLNEMTCRYSRGYARKYLTDGGHYENSGAYILIRRHVPLILVTDNGADPEYAFADLESLVRQVRIDLGAETTILGGAELSAVLSALDATDPSIFVDPDLHPNWRKRMRRAKDQAYVLVLRVAIAGETLHMIWLKPKLLPGLPTDVSGYATAMKAFPQQPTGDQFFDEAQWESYRRLGEFAMTRLLETCPRLLA